MRANEFILLSNIFNESLTATNQTTIQGGQIYSMSVVNDKFIHFTTLDRAREIIQSSKLMMNPPYDKFGIDAVTAVSLVYGTSVPSVQTTHSSGNLVGIIFTTNTNPKYGHVEEVIWDRDVELKNPKVVLIKKGVELLKSVPYPITDEDEVQYI